MNTCLLLSNSSSKYYFPSNYTSHILHCRFVQMISPSSTTYLSLVLCRAGCVSSPSLPSPSCGYITSKCLQARHSMTTVISELMYTCPQMIAHSLIRSSICLTKSKKGKNETKGKKLEMKS